MRKELRERHSKQREEKTHRHRGKNSWACLRSRNKICGAEEHEKGKEKLGAVMLETQAGARGRVALQACSGVLILL